MLAGGGVVDGPVASGADLAGAAALVALESAAADIRRRGVGGQDLGGGDVELTLLAEFIVETFVFEVALFLCHPFLEATVGVNPELSHVSYSSSYGPRYARCPSASARIAATPGSTFPA